MLDKVFPDARAALHDVTDGMTLFCGGFGLSGVPEELIFALRVAPIEVPITQSGAIPASCSASYTPT